PVGHRHRIMDHRVPTLPGRLRPTDDRRAAAALRHGSRSHPLRLIDHDHSRHARRSDRGRNVDAAARPVRPRPVRGLGGRRPGRADRYGVTTAGDDPRPRAGRRSRVRRRTLMTVVVSICALILAAAIIIGLVRVLTARDLGSRAVVSDLIYFSSVAIVTMLGIAVSSSIVLDVVFLASMVGILATIALSRILTRGHR